MYEWVLDYSAVNNLGAMFIHLNVDDGVMPCLSQNPAKQCDHIGVEGVRCPLGEFYQVTSRGCGQLMSNSIRNCSLSINHWRWVWSQILLTGVES